MHTHSKISKLIWFVIIIILAVGGYLYYKKNHPADPFDKIDIVSDEIPKGKVGMSMYENYLYKFKFEYPENLYLKEKEAGSSVKPQLNLVLVEGTKENIDLIEGTYQGVPREGPIAITLDVYINPKKLDPSAWAMQDPNWNIGSKKTTEVMVGKEKGVSFTWTGLYEGKSFIITKGEKAFVFSVTKMTPEDQILKDFDMILNSFSFTE